MVRSVAGRADGRSGQDAARDSGGDGNVGESRRICLWDEAVDAERLYVSVRPVHTDLLVRVQRCCLFDGEI